MKIHILGICGTFMGGIALLARQAGHAVSGSDANVYPPMSTQLEAQGIELCEGYRPEHIADDVDEVIIGNALSRGNAAVEYVLDRGLAYTSGAEWLARNVLRGRWVLAVAGTHGKTTTSSLLAWILHDAGLEPGFLIGGVPANFGLSARAGKSPFFVVEADEYDTAFFDKRSKFVHYRPRTAILNNLEFDHADIFDDLDAIKKQFHHFVRTIPGEGLIVHNGDDANLDAVLAMGCWSQRAAFHAGREGRGWSLGACSEDGRRFEVLHNGEAVATVEWALHGAHNRLNALAAMAAAQHAGVPVTAAAEALGRFRGIKRRLEVCGEVNGVTVYDDFAHHPTAIAETLAAMAEVRAGARSESRANGRLIAVLEPRSNTMRMGVHKQALADALQGADMICLYRPPGLDWALDEAMAASATPAHIFDSTEALIRHLQDTARPGDHILIMSNGGFEAIHQRLLEALHA